MCGSRAQSPCCATGGKSDKHRTALSRPSKHPERVGIYGEQGAFITTYAYREAKKLLDSGDAYPMTRDGGEVANWRERKDLYIQRIRLTVSPSVEHSKTYITLAEMQVNAFIQAGLMRSGTYHLSDKARQRINDSRLRCGVGPLPEEDFAERVTHKIEAWPDIWGGVDHGAPAR